MHEFSVFSVVIRLILLCMSHSGEVPEYQKNGLYYLYNSTGGFNWTWTPSNDTIPWDFSSNSDPCMDNWQGITCTTNCSQYSVCDIETITLAEHNLIGSIPSQISLVSHLQVFNIFHNTVRGSIPTSFGLLTDLTSIIIYRNYMTGPIPTELGMLKKMDYFDLGANELNGSIPWLDIPLVTVYYADTNKLTGTIPTAFGTLEYMTLMAVCGNSLTGTVPSELGALSQLSVLNLYDNQLSGSIPTTFNALTNLRIFNVAHNLLTGPADSMILSNSIIYFYMSINFFTGALPFEQLCKSDSLLTVLFAENLLTGTISSCVSNWSAINTIDFSRNDLEGSVPVEFSSLDTLQTLILGSNSLTGSLDNVLSQNLVTLDISDNGFSGSVPFSVFSSESLVTAIMAKNCFSGTLSSEMCNAGSLRTLELSGLTAGSSCVSEVDFMGFNMYVASTYRGSIPSCVFSMANLSHISISGNSIKSKLSDVPEDSPLYAMALSNNRLSGTIPASIQTRFQLEYLDLSFNRLKGTIEDMTNYSMGTATSSSAASGTDTEPTTLYLQSNRLSGYLPSVFSNAMSVMNILAGNEFQCANRDKLPQNDPDANKYICGSKEYNIFVAVYWGCFGFALVFGIAMVYFYDFENSTHPVFQLITKSKVLKLFIINLRWSSGYTTGHGYLDILATSLSQYRHLSMVILLIILVIVLPSYVLLKQTGDISTHSHQYGWFLSIAYMQYYQPGIVAAVLWFLIIVYVLCYEFCYVKRDCRKSDTSYRMSMKIKFITAGFIFCNVIITLLVNGVYVYITFTQSIDIQAVFSFLVIVYKLVWNSAVVIPVFELLRCKFVTVMTVMIFNNVLAPILATMAVNINCFESLFVQQDPLSTTYSVSHCSYLFTGTTTLSGTGTSILVCDLYDMVSNTIVFEAPFIYSNQCSSALLTTYVPLYIATYGIVGIMVTVFQFAVLLFFSSCEVDENEPNTNGRSSSPPSDADARMVPHDGKRKLLTVLKKNLHFYSAITNKVFSGMVLPITSKEDMVLSGRQSFYHARQAALNFSVIFTILLTFGIACPLLSVILVINILLGTIVMQICYYKHYVQVKRLNLLDTWNELLIKETKDVHKILFGSRTIILVFSSCFACLFVFDMTFFNNNSAMIGLIVALLASVAISVKIFQYLRLHYARLSAGSYSITANEPEGKKQNIELMTIHRLTLVSAVDNSIDKEGVIVENPIQNK